jgi:hypothetical protein
MKGTKGSDEKSENCMEEDEILNRTESERRKGNHEDTYLSVAPVLSDGWRG